MILCYDIGDAVDACGLARGRRPLHLESASHMTPDLGAVSCSLCLAAVQMMAF